MSIVKRSLKYLRRTLRLTFEEGSSMYDIPAVEDILIFRNIGDEGGAEEAGVEVDRLGDVNTESERKLGQPVLENMHDTNFYILHGYPLAARLFYTMPCYDDPNNSNSFDVFMRGEEIISGSQRVHLPDLLAEQAADYGIDASTIYIKLY